MAQIFNELKSHPAPCATGADRATSSTRCPPCGYNSLFSFSNFIRAGTDLSTPSIKHSERHVVVLAVGRDPIGSRLSGSGKLLLRYCAMDVRDDSDDLLASCERQGNLLAE